jgi:hypothetical protein
MWFRDPEVRLILSIQRKVYAAADLLQRRLGTIKGECGGRSVVSLVAAITRLSGVGKANRVKVPCCMGEPLFRPAPILVLAGDCKSIIEGDLVLVVEASGDAVDDGSWCVGVLIRSKEHIGCVAVPAAHQHAGIEWVSAKDPV